MSGVRVLVGEEVSHSVDSGTRVQNRAAADWLKQLMDREFTLILEIRGDYVLDLLVLEGPTSGEHLVDY